MGHKTVSDARWPLVRQLVVVSPLLSCRRRLSSFQHAASAFLLSTRSLPCDEPPPLCDTPPPLVSWHLSSRLPLFWRLVLTYHLITPPPQVPILDPRLHSHWLVVASHLVALLPPTVLSSTPPPIDALATHLPLLFASTGCLCV